MNPLNKELNCLSLEDDGTKSAIIDALWPRKTPIDLGKAEHHDWNPYFTYYLQQCKHFELNRSVPIVHCHQDIVDIRDLFLKGISRKKIEADISARFKALRKKESCEDKEDVVEKAALDAVNLVARLYFMVNVKHATIPGQHSQTYTPGRTIHQWPFGSPRLFLSNQFDRSRQNVTMSIRFEKSFTARNIERIAGIRIHWTDDLADHLRMIDSEDKKVAIFHYASFLKHQNAENCPLQVQPLYPKGLIEETLRTLALLFPQNDQKLKTWLASQSTHNYKGSEVHLDKQLARCGFLCLEQRQQNKFSFWQDRLIILKQAYDESKPGTLSQWWLDRRNYVQWYTFWVAIVVLLLTIFFGFVQSIEGALQVYKAYKPSK